MNFSQFYTSHRIFIDVVNSRIKMFDSFRFFIEKHCNKKVDMNIRELNAHEMHIDGNYANDV